MHIGFNGQLEDRPRLRAGFIGCGSHAFRNIYPTFQFAPIDLVATCDLDIAKARAFADQFGAAAAYDDAAAMLERDDLDAVFIVTGYDGRGRPRYPDLAVQCLESGRHVWMEKPPGASCADIDRMIAAADRAGRRVMVGLKKMFFPANEKALELSRRDDFGRVSLVSLQYPQSIPTVEQLERYLAGEASPEATAFLDHLCHPASWLVLLMGMPRDMVYQRAGSGAGAATFTFDGGAVASLLLSHGASNNGGMERTTIVSDRGRHIVVDNHTRVSYHRTPPGLGYGTSPSYFLGEPEDATAVWEPEFSLGQLYNKGLFLLGYYGEVAEFAAAVLEDRPLRKGTLRQARQVTRIFEAFAEGPGRVISLGE